jgi:hypothetical protein
MYSCSTTGLAALGTVIVVVIVVVCTIEDESQFGSMYAYRNRNPSSRNRREVDTVGNETQSSQFPKPSQSQETKKLQANKTQKVRADTAAITPWSLPCTAVRSLCLAECFSILLTRSRRRSARHGTARRVWAQQRPTGYYAETYLNLWGWKGYYSISHTHTHTKQRTNNTIHLLFHYIANQLAP